MEREDILDVVSYDNIADIIMAIYQRSKQEAPEIDDEVFEYQAEFAADFCRFTIMVLSAAENTIKIVPLFVKDLGDLSQQRNLTTFMMALSLLSSRFFVGCGLLHPPACPPRLLAAQAIREVGGPSIVPQTAPRNDPGREIQVAEAMCEAAGGCGSLRFATSLLATRVVDYGGAEALAALNDAGGLLADERPDLLFRMLVSGLETLCVFRMAKIAHVSDASRSLHTSAGPTASA